MKKLILVLAASALLFGCQTEKQPTIQQTAIDNVYKQDANFASSSKMVSEVVMKLKTVDLTGTPEAFASAYKANISAWEKFAEIEQKMYKDADAGGIEKAQKDIKNFLSTYSTDASKASVQLLAAWPKYRKDIETVLADIATTKGKYMQIGNQNGSIYPKSGGLF